MQRGKNPRKFQGLAAGACFALVAVLGAGCGKEGPKRYEISGKVTFNGAPLPAGTISAQGSRSFTPCPFSAWPA